MLQIRLNKGPSSDGDSGMKSLPVETVMVACPEHLVLADLPVAKGLGSATSVSRVKTIGRRSRRQLGERVHFCVRCDFPIAIYGRLTPCEHAFCLDCARSDSICYLCDERIQKIQTIKMMEGIFVCAAPHCLKSFLKKSEFESHIHGSHADLLQPKMKKEEVNESDAFTVKPSAGSESSVRPLQTPGFPPSSNPPLSEREDRTRSQQSREQTPLRPLMQPRLPPYYGQSPSAPSDLPQESTPQRPDGYNNLQTPVPVYYQQPPNFAVPINPGQAPPNRPPFGFPPFPSDGAPFNGIPMNYEVTPPDSTPEVRSAEQGSLMGFPPGHAAPPGFSEIHQHPWAAGPGNGVPFEAIQGAQGVMVDGLQYPSDPHGRGAFFQGDYGRNSNNLAFNPAAVQNQAGNTMDSRDGQGIMASMPPPPRPGPPPAHLFQQKHDNYFSGDGWSEQKRDGF